MPDLDAVQLHFRPETLRLLNVILAFLMFGVALELKPADFRALWRQPRATLGGLAAQFLLLPAATFGLVYLFQPPASVALGMLLVAACPGGNMSNFLSHFAGGNAALSVTLTAAGTVLALFFTPFNVGVWAHAYGPAAALLRSFSLDTASMLTAIFTLAVLPLALGMLIAQWRPGWARTLAKWVRPASLVVFVLLIVFAFRNNYAVFAKHMGAIAWIVLIHNAAALALGWAVARVLRLGEANRRTLTFETGIQNSGLGLVIIFGYFDGLGGMAVIAAWWGIWHLVSGLGLALYWSRKPLLISA